MNRQREGAGKNFRSNLSGQQLDKEFDTPDIEGLPPVTPGFVDHDGPLVWATPWLNKPVEIFTVVHRSPGDYSGTRRFQLHWLRLAALPQHLECLVTLRNGPGQFVMTIRTARLKHPQIPVDPATPEGVHQISVITGQSDPEFAGHTSPVRPPGNTFRRRDQPAQPLDMYVHGFDLLKTVWNMPGPPIPPRTGAIITHAGSVCHNLFDSSVKCHRRPTETFRPIPTRARTGRAQQGHDQIASATQPSPHQMNRVTCPSAVRVRRFPCSAISRTLCRTSGSELPSRTRVEIWSLISKPSRGLRSGIVPAGIKTAAVVSLPSLNKESNC